MLHLLASLALVAVTLIGARRFGVRRIALPACVPLLMSMTASLQWVLVSGLAPAPLIGLLAAVQVERGRRFGEIIAMASAPGAALALILMLGLDGVAGSRQELSQQIERSLTDMGAQMPETEQMQHLIDLMLQLFPGMAYLSLLFVAVVGYRIAHSIGPRVGTLLPTPPPMRQWRLWDEMIWIVVAALGLVLVAGGGLRILGANVLVVAAALYAVQGLALVKHALWRFGVQRFLEVAIYALLIFTSGVSFVILGLLGLMDTWFDWRRLDPARHDGQAEDDDQ